jgi:hypothetical protein
VDIATHADPLYQHLIVTAERKFWGCFQAGAASAVRGRLKPHIEAVRIVDMNESNTWAEFVAVLARTREAPCRT